MNCQNLALDLRVGGLGDNWMRLIGFYVAAALRPNLRLELTLPANLVRVARHVFSDRLEISGEARPGAVVFTGLGLRDLVSPVLRGRRFVSPYGRSVIHDGKRRGFKDRLNLLGLAVFDRAGLVVSPPWFTLNHYQGYAEVVALPALRDISPAEFDTRLTQDCPEIRRRLADAPRSAEFELPGGLEQKTVVFPTGTSRQFVPLEWARTHLPEAVFAFFHKDPDLEVWRKSGLEVAAFYREPGDMLALAMAARATASTDSFPSHFLQYGAPRLVVMLTELAAHRVVSPAFRGRVIPSLAPCHPCLHMERKGFPLCQAGHPACLNWQSPAYAELIKKALADAAAEDWAGFKTSAAALQK